MENVIETVPYGTRETTHNKELLLAARDLSLLVGPSSCASGTWTHHARARGGRLVPRRRSVHSTVESFQQRVGGGRLLLVGCGRVAVPTAGVVRGRIRGILVGISDWVLLDGTRISDAISDSGRNSAISRIRFRVNGGATNFGAWTGVLGWLSGVCLRGRVGDIRERRR